MVYPRFCRADRSIYSETRHLLPCHVGKADYAYTINTISPALIITHSADYHLLHMQSAIGGTLGTRYAFFRDAANTRFWFTIRKDRVADYLPAFGSSPIQLEPMSAPQVDR
jgi:hypothetical protein